LKLKNNTKKKKKKKKLKHRDVRAPDARLLIDMRYNGCDVSQTMRLAWWIQRSEGDEHAKLLDASTSSSIIIVPVVEVGVSRPE